MEDPSIDDDDLKVQRASTYAVARIKHGVKQLLSCLEGAEKLQKLQQDFHAKKLAQKVANLLSMFQEDPQLLDPHLKHFLPQLIVRFTTLVETSYEAKLFDEVIRLSIIAEIIYTFCKVRGEKVFTRFLDNEPAQMMPILTTLEALTSAKDLKEESAGSTTIKIATTDFHQDLWKLRYVLIVWVGHLILTPFSLESISQSSTPISLKVKGFENISLPDLGTRLLNLAFIYINSPTKERTAAASMLSRLALRPDMSSMGLLECSVNWSVHAMSITTDSEQDDHEEMFLLEFLHGLMRAGNVYELSPFLQDLFRIVDDSFKDGNDLETNLRLSAVAKKWSIKVLRGIVTFLLNIPSSGTAQSQVVYDRMMNQDHVLEDVIDSLLRCLADRDTQVRCAASKALSVITIKLEKHMAKEIVEAVLDSMKDDILGFDRFSESPDLSAVNPLKWHGLTLTLSYMLFRRSPSPDQLEPILSALYRTLSFEQRSVTGNSLGTNVRDAANFGLWSLARMYSTAELLNESRNRDGNVSEIQKTANHLLVSACLDPAGNVRRGSSAALQELIGRHPDTIEQGISLVQIVDYQAVGLRRRAMIDISFQASKLQEKYLLELLDGLFGWRGLFAPDAVSRNHAAVAVGRLINELPTKKHSLFISKIISSLRAQPFREIEARHGLIRAISEVILRRASATKDSNTHSCERKSSFETVPEIWSLFRDVLTYSEKDLTTASLRPELTIEALLSLICSLTLFTSKTSKFSQVNDVQISASAIDVVQSLTSLLTKCLNTLDEATLAMVPQACESTSMILKPEIRVELAETWLKALDRNKTSRRRSGTMLALASIWQTLPSGQSSELELETFKEIQRRIFETLIGIFEMDNIDARVISMRSIALLMHKSSANAQVFQDRILEIYARGLNDYTTNERGDVGSLVRLEAIRALSDAGNIFQMSMSQDARRCLLSIQRLAMERLDKVRLEAAQCLSTGWPNLSLQLITLPDVSNFEYFAKLGLFVLTNSSLGPERAYEASASRENIQAFLEGLASSSTGGSDFLSTTARSTVSSILLALPVLPSSSPSQPGDLSIFIKEHRFPSLLEISNVLMDLIKANIANDRTLLPLLELTLFLLDIGTFQILMEASNKLQIFGPSHSIISLFKVRTLLFLIQKAHYKSSSLPKLLTCVQIYGHIATVADLSTRRETLKKLGSMLSHPFAKVRVRVAEALWSATGCKSLRDVDWGLPASSNANEANAVARLVLQSVEEPSIG